MTMRARRRRYVRRPASVERRLTRIWERLKPVPLQVYLDRFASKSGFWIVDNTPTGGAMRDLLTYGTAVTEGGRHVPLRDVLKD